MLTDAETTRLDAALPPTAGSRYGARQMAELDRRAPTMEVRRSLGVSRP